MAKVLLKVADPGKASKESETMYTPGRGKYETDMDLRDKVAELAVMGASLKPDDKAAILGYLTNTLGADKAQKLMTHAYLFNSRPDMQGRSPEEKIKSFYTIGSNDPSVMEVLNRTKNLGYGILPGFRESVSNLNQAIQGNVGAAAINPEAQKKVMLRVGK